MTPDEVAIVLTKASAFDQRTIGETDVMAWHEVLVDIAVDDALAAVTEHYRDSSTRLWPADLRRIAAGIDHRRRGAERRREIEAVAEQEQLGRGPAVDRHAETAALLGEVLARVSSPDADPVRERALARARKERGRPAPTPPRQRYQPRKPTFTGPQTYEMEALVLRYLLDGYTPEQASERFSVSKKWCQRALRKFRGGD